VESIPKRQQGVQEQERGGVLQEQERQQSEPHWQHQPLLPRDEEQASQKTTANQQVELAKANARHKAYKQATTVSYSSITQVTPMQVLHQRPEYQPQQPKLRAIGSALQDLASVLARMDARMAAMELHITCTA
jgi:hypothetical protein